MIGPRNPGMTALLGALELKRCYYRNLMMATLIVFGAGLVICLTVLLFSARAESPKDLGTWAGIVDSLNVILLQPPPTVEPPTEIKQSTPPPLEKELITSESIEPVPSETPLESEPLIASPAELSTRQNRIAASAGTGSGIPVNAQERPDFMSSPDTFDVVEKFPNAIKLVAPHYPSIARRAGIEGKVWVKVLIDRDGSVIDAIIQLESGADAGFEEAALEAARQGVWSPGLQNNQPVRVWVAYEIKFQLR